MLMIFIVIGDGGGVRLLGAMVVMGAMMVMGGVMVDWWLLGGGRWLTVGYRERWWLYKSTQNLVYADVS